jgi:hypothetical protein
MLDDLAALNELKLREQGDPEPRPRIAQYEMAFRMQASVPDLIDVSQEPKSILDLYGPDCRKAGTVRGELPAGATPGREGRALHPALPPRLGPAHQPSARHPPAVPGHGPADRGARAGPEAARASWTTR